MKTPHLYKHLVRLSCAAALAAVSCHAEECAPLSAEVRGRIAIYVAQRYELAPDVRVEGGETVSNSCFRRLTAHSAAPTRTIELFISPDQRFVTEALQDTWVDSTVERERAARVAEAALLADASPSKGPSGPAVTAVEFSDFECPFCKRAADALADLPEDIRQDVRVVFKQRPLSMHQWARRAALASICASLQSEDAFWAVEKLLFANQERIKTDTLDETIRGFAAGLPRLNIGRLEACLAANEGAATLVRDERLAEAYHVDVTPTIFVNGVRKTGFNTPEALWSALRLAAFDARRAAGTPLARDESPPGRR